MYTVSSSPHIRGGQPVNQIMLDVLIALAPAILFSAVRMGSRSILLVLLSALFSVGFEFLYQKLTKQEVTISDLSATVTGVLIAMNLPVTAPWWFTLVGSFVAIIIAKQIFGGIGCNFVNPALIARAFLMSSWLREMSTFTSSPVSIFRKVDYLTSATPLAILKNPSLGEMPSYMDMFIGNIGGCLGEVSALFLLLGFIYLLIRGVVTSVIPLTYIGTVFVLTFLLGQNPLYHILSGGLFLGAIFMATDYTTSPMRKKGQLIYAIGCGVLTVVIRLYGGYPEGVSYSILIMNVVAPLLDRR